MSNRCLATPNAPSAPPDRRLRAALAATAALLACHSPSLRAVEGGPARGVEGPISSPRQLTFEGRRAGEGYFSADGGEMVFQSERHPGNPFYQIYRIDLTTGETRRVSPGRGKTTCGWLHPDGERVLFASTHLDPEADAKQERELAERASGHRRRYAWDYDEHYDLFERVPGQDAPVRLTRARGYDAEASWSPDAKHIVFASNRHAYRAEFQQSLGPAERKRFAADKSAFVDLYVLEASSGETRRLTDSPGYDGGPFFSPDGSRIVWRRFAPDGHTAEIYSMALDGSDERQLTRLGAISWAPFYHPSGDYIAFSTNLHGFDDFELYLVDSEGGRDPVRVTNTRGFDGLPVFSPDGARIAWTSQRSADRSSQIFLADWDDAAARRLLGIGPASRAIPSSAEAIASTPTRIGSTALRSHVEELSAEATQGRLTGTAGERIATDYVAGAFRALGLEPAGDDGSFFQDFDFTSGVSLGAGNELRVAYEELPLDAAPQVDRAWRPTVDRDWRPTVDRDWRPTVDRDWRPLAFSKVGSVEASEVVFAGYGIVAPASPRHPAVDSYQGLDVEDRWVMVFRFLPEETGPARRQYLNRFSGLRYKAMIARDRGARGLLVVSGPRSKVREELPPLQFDVSLAGSGIAALSITDETAARLLAASGQDLEALQRSFDEAEGREGFALEGVRLGADVDLRQQRRSGRNVLARLRGRARPARPLVLVGAHLDHLGRGLGSTSLARSGERGSIHPGADDNASGVAALLEIARELAALRANGTLSVGRDIVFAAWSGEELGLLGSSHFATALAGRDDPHADLSNEILAYLNLDMVGRLRESLFLYGVGSSSAWAAEIERANAPIGLPLHLQNDSYLPTDATPFYLHGVPILSAFTGAHAEYHTPRDRPETLDYDGLREIAELLSRITQSLATRDAPLDYQAAKGPPPGTRRAGLRVYLGTIPDYAQADLAGVRLAGVARPGPAADAGLRAGDLIVEVAGREIQNIYDYTYALEALRVGEPIEVGVVRDGERISLELVPASRD